MKLLEIEARDLPDAWFQTVYKALDEGHVFKIDRGSFAGQKRLEFDHITIQIKYPGVRPLLPQIPEHYGIPNPVADGYLDEYMPYLMTGELKPGESYTYGQRLTRYPISKEWMKYSIPRHEDILIQDDDIWDNPNIVIRENDNFFLNQIELLIWTYKNKGFRNNQMVLQVAHPNDMLLQDPCCLRSIDTRIQNGKLHFIPYFRSWDLFNGLPANLGAIQLMKEYVAESIGVDDGEIIASSKGLHLYDYTFDMAKMLAMKDEMQLKTGSN